MKDRFRPHEKNRRPRTTHNGDSPRTASHTSCRLCCFSEWRTCFKRHAPSSPLVSSLTLLFADATSVIVLSLRLDAVFRSDYLSKWTNVGQSVDKAHANPDVQPLSVACALSLVYSSRRLFPFSQATTYPYTVTSRSYDAMSSHISISNIYAPNRPYDTWEPRTDQRQALGSRQIQPVTTPTEDPYYGFEVRAKICARFIAHHFGIFAPPPGVVSLDKFIAWVIYRTQYRSSTTFAALYLTGLLKERFLDQVVSNSRLTCHRLFLAAFMVASKSIHDNSYKNTAFADLADKEIATVNELNTMEREILRFIDWKVNIPREVVEEFRRMVEHDFCGAGPYPKYRYSPPGAKGAPLQIPTTVLLESPVPGVLTTRPAAPSVFLPPEPTVSHSYPPTPQTRASPPQWGRSVTPYKNRPATMQQVHRAPVSIVVPPPVEPRHAMTRSPPARMAAASAATPYMLQTGPRRNATLPQSSHQSPCTSPDEDWVDVVSGGPAIVW